MRHHLLAATAVVIASSGAAQPAQQAVALSELETLANAMSLVWLDTGYYTTLENLNDLPSFPTVVDYDFINDEGGALAIRSFSGQFGSPARVDFLNLPATFAWQGPYITVQSNRTDGPASDYDEGTPLDPWGTPYWFYTPVGLVEPITETVSLRFYGDDFPDYRIVSHGPDGEFGGGDDLDRTVAFHTITSTVITSVRIGSGGSRSAAMPRGTGLVATFKGYNFGATQGAGGVAAGAAPLTVLSWSNNLVTAAIGSLPAPATTFTLTRSGGQVLSFNGFIDEVGSSAVRDWALYD